MPTSPSTFKKDPDSVLDFAFNWADWLDAAEEITSSEVIASPGITVDSSSNTTDTVVVWLSGGTAGQPYTVTNRITTNQGRTDDRTMTIRVLER